MSSGHCLVNGEVGGKLATDTEGLEKRTYCVISEICSSAFEERPGHEARSFLQIRKCKSDVLTLWDDAATCGVAR